MRLEQKKAITDQIAARLREAESFYLADFTGLDAAEQDELRGKLLEQGAEFKVVKNTLAIRALEGLDVPDVRAQLKGPTAIVLSGADPVSPARVVRNFAKDHDNKPVVKIGVVDRRAITPADVEKLADLPSREVLLGGIAGALTASVGGIAGVLGGLIRDIAVMIEEVAKKGEGQG